MINTSVPKGRKDAICSITSLCRIKTPAPAFSLMEMMVVMLVVAVVMAIAAPMVAKKLSSHDGGGDGGSLLTSITGGNVAYNLRGNSNAIIYGGSSSEVSTMSSYAGKLPRLIINGTGAEGKTNENAQIGFMYTSDPDTAAVATGTMLVGNNNRIYIGAERGVPLAVNNAIAIGQSVSASENSILIGGMSSYPLNGSSAVAIGYNTKGVDSAVTLGASAETRGSGSVAIGESTYVRATDGVAIGYASTTGAGVAIGGKNDKGRASVGSGVALGSNTVAGSGLALGHGANVNSTSCYAIGAGAVCPEDSDPSNPEAFRNPLYLGGRSNIKLEASSGLSSYFKEGDFYAANGLSFIGSVRVPHPDNEEHGEVDLIINKNYYTGSLSANTINGGDYISASYGYFDNYNVDIDEENKCPFTILEEKMEDLNLEGYYDNLLNTINNISHVDAYYHHVTIIHTTRYNCTCTGTHSDARLKDIIGENLDAMDKINRLKVYDFTFKDDESKTKHVGVIAQELQKVFPNAVKEDEDGYLHIRHEDIFYAMVNSLKDLSSRVKKIAQNLSDSINLVTDNKTRIATLQAKIETKDQEIASLKEELADLEILVNEVVNK